MFRLVSIALTLFFCASGLANDEDRVERRDLRERREKVRTAIRRLNRCMEMGDLTPCLETDDDQETRDAVMRYMLKKANEHHRRRPAQE